ncbi:LysR family transcriptional regulator [Muricoccus radiodurans]|uniref:LysR family transcriptional regulator n=1 Tax=Muricoccus radiodurans TaxID=2231721 RepID=UPI003CFBA98A
MRPSLRQLEILAAVVEHGSFSAAGQRLGLVQPAVSLAIRKLEDGFGVRLLDRSVTPLRLTAEGEALLGHARRVLGEVDRLGRHMRELTQLGAGQVSVGAPPHVSGFILPAIVGGFLAQHPGIHVHAVEDSSASVIERVRTGEVDVGVVAGQHSFERLEVLRLDDQPLVACVAATSPLARRAALGWEELFEQPLILFPEGYNQRALVTEVAARLGRTPHVLCEGESGNLVTALVRGGFGLSVMFAAIAAATPGVRAVPILGGPSVPVTVCRAQGGVRSLAAQAFFEAAGVRHEPAPSPAPRRKSR